MTTSEIQCPFCGGILPATASFCRDCGKTLSLLRVLQPQANLPVSPTQDKDFAPVKQLPSDIQKASGESLLQSQSEQVNRQSSSSALLSQFNQSAQNRALNNQRQANKSLPPQNSAYVNNPIPSNVASLPQVANMNPYPALPVTTFDSALHFGRARALKRGLGLASLILGIIALMFSLVIVGVIFAVAGIVAGIVAIVKANSEPLLYGGKGLAKGGIASSGIAVVFALLILFVALPKLSGHRLTGATWHRYEIGGNNLSLELPGAPKKLNIPQFDNLPPDVRENITLSELQESQYNDFVVTIGVLGYTDKIEYDNQCGVAGMIAALKNRPEFSNVEYSTSVLGSSMLSVTGTMKFNGRPTILNGFVENHGRKVITVLTFYGQTNKDAPTAAQRVFKSINFK